MAFVDELAPIRTCACIAMTSGPSDLLDLLAIIAVAPQMAHFYLADQARARRV
jgi:hypothetical protein